MSPVTRPSATRLSAIMLECWRYVPTPEPSLTMRKSKKFVVVATASLLLLLAMAQAAEARHRHRLASDLPPSSPTSECPTKKEAEIKYPGKRVYWHTSAHCWDAEPVINGKYRAYQRTAADVDVTPPPKPKEPDTVSLESWTINKPFPPFKTLKVRPVAGRFVPWEDRVSGAEFRKSLIGE